MIKRYQYRIYPNKQQRQYFQKIFGCCRFVYNWGLDIKDTSYKEQKDNGTEKPKTPSKKELLRMFTQLKNNKGYNWLNEPNSEILRNVLTNLDLAFKNFFERLKKVKLGLLPMDEVGYPTYKSKYGEKNTFSFYRDYEINQEEGWITIPRSNNHPSVGKIKVRFHRKFDGINKTCTIIKDNTNRYYASIVVHNNEVAKKEKESKENLLGLDHGVKRNITLSNGEVFLIDLDFSKEEKRLKRLERAKARKKKGSKNFAKNKLQIAKIYKNIAQKRKYRIENMVCQLAEYLVFNNYDGVIIRKYDVKGMTKKKKPIKDENGKYKENGRERQRKINKSILNASLGAVFQQILYKVEQNGLHVFPIEATDNRTTKRCNNCGAEKDEEIKINLKTRLFECRKCGYVEDLDYNAAKNIYSLFMQDFEKQEVAA